MQLNLISESHRRNSLFCAYQHCPWAEQNKKQKQKQKHEAKEEDKELMKRLTGKAWAPDRDDPRSGVEQLKRKMEAQIKRDNEKQKEAAGIKKKDKRDLKSRKELEEVR